MAFSIHKIGPGDYLIDGKGAVWKVVGVCLSPSVKLERVEKCGDDIADKLSFGIGGTMAEEFTKLVPETA